MLNVSDKMSASSLSATIKALETLMRSHMKTLGGGDEKKKEEPILSLFPVKKDPKIEEGMKNLANLAFRKEKVTVYVRIVFLKIGVIDTIHDRYAAEVMVQTKWREPSLDRKKLTNDQLTFDNFWNPKVSISNGIGDLKYATSVGVQYDPSGNAWLCEKRKTNGQFFEFMELNKFPFDGQDLTITVTTERLDAELEFKEEEQEESGVNRDAFSAAQEWALRDKVNIWTKFNVKKVNKKKAKYPCFCVAAKVSRRPQFFIYNIIVIMFSICSLAFSTFTVKMETPESRLPLTFILVLTTVTFKFVVNKSLPKISYLTYLDKYILGSMFILVTVCIWHSIAGSILHRLTQVETKSVVTNFTTVASITRITTASSSPATTTPAATVTCTQPTKNPTSANGKLIDQMALALLASVYIGFHITFLFLILCNKGDDDVNEDLNMDEDDDDEDEQTKANRSNMTMVAFGLLNKDDKPNNEKSKEVEVEKEKSLSARLRTANNNLPTVQE